MTLTSRFRPSTTIVHAAFSVAAALLYSACGGKSPMKPTSNPLKVISVLPPSGSTTGGTAVTVTGAEFMSDATVMVGGIPASGVVVQGPTTLTATIAARPAGGPADVVVMSAGQSATLAGGFTFVPPSGANRPPAITNFTSVGSRPGQPAGFVDVDEPVTIVATVTDPETAVSGLQFAWSGAGAFSGAGPTIGWRAPIVSPTPTPVSVSLRATESYNEGTIGHRNETTAAYVLQVHDSQKEVMDAGEDFLTLFSRSEVPTNDVLRNFSTTCDGGRGRDDERNDVDRNRDTYVHDFSKFRISRNPPVTFNFGGRCPFRLRRADACSSYTVHWEVTYRSNGAREVTDGVDYVTAVLENNRWLLCHSDFAGTSTNLTTGITRLVSW